MSGLMMTGLAIIGILVAIAIGTFVWWLGRRIGLVWFVASIVWLWKNKSGMAITLLSIPLIIIIAPLVPVVYHWLSTGTWWLYDKTFDPAAAASAPATPTVVLDEDEIYSAFADPAIVGGWSVMPTEVESTVNFGKDQTYTKLNAWGMQSFHTSWTKDPRAKYRLNLNINGGRGLTSITQNDENWTMEGPEGKVMLELTGKNDPGPMRVILEATPATDGYVLIRTEATFDGGTDVTWGKLWLELDGQPLEWELRVEFSREDGTLFQKMPGLKAKIAIGKDPKDAHRCVKAVDNFLSTMVKKEGNLKIHVPETGEKVLVQVMLQVRQKK